MDWPTSADYGEAVQNLKHSMSDGELRAGEAAVGYFGLPLLWAGGFADVYKIHNVKTGNTWALKCFTRKVTGQEDRYRHISEHLKQARLPFMVDFSFLNEGVRIRGQWFPALKMRWVEGGIRLNEFVEEYLERPRMLRQLLDLWPRMASRLRQKEIAHADLQHGNVLLIPRSDKHLALRLIDYDGMHVPALASTPSAELGHPAFQHPQRSREGIYSAEIDRFSHLAIYSAVHSLTVGGKELWERFNNGDNLLFREDDFQDSANSELFHALWEVPDPDCRSLVGRLALACNAPLDKTPLLKDITNGQVLPLLPVEQKAVQQLLGTNAAVFPAAVREPAEEHAENAPYLDENVQFTVYRPKKVRPDKWCHLLAFAHLSERPEDAEEDDPDPLEEVQRQAERFLGGESREYRESTEDASQAVPKGGELTFLPEIEGVEFNPPQQSFRWVEDVHRVDFRMRASPKLDGTVARGQMSVFLGAILLADIRLSIQVKSGFVTAKEEAPSEKAQAEPYRKIFASYSHKDLAIVEQFERYAESLGDKYLRDWKDLRAGEHWDERLREMIREANVFQLFWSSNSMHSSFVRQEWEYALSMGGQQFVRPVYWESEFPKAPGLPPVELARLHFQRIRTETGSRDAHVSVSQESLAMEASQPVGDRSEAVFEWTNSEPSPADDSLRSVLPEAVPRRRTPWLLLPTLFRALDWPLKKIAGEENAIVHNFFRLIASVVLAMLIFFVGARVVPVWIETVAEMLEVRKEKLSPAGPEPVPLSAPVAPLDATELPQDHTNDIGMQFKLIPSGEFLMGSPEDDPDRRSDEIPQHHVQITTPFYLGIHEVTQEQYEKVIGENPSHHKGATRPVEQVSWGDANQFCTKLSEMDEEYDYRLPTEAEWEYACRAGTSTRYSSGDELDCAIVGGRMPRPVGRQQPNAWGLYDMHGNVWEWCSDWYDDYGSSPSADPTGPSFGSNRVYRGGSWGFTARGCRSANRCRSWPVIRGFNLGFRVALVPAE